MDGGSGRKKMTFNLSKKRMGLFREMCKILPYFKWGLLFEKIGNQDKEFVRLLKEMTLKWVKEYQDNKTNYMGWLGRLDKLVEENL